MAKALHWGGKVYPIAECLLCKKNGPVLGEQANQKFGPQTLCLVPKGICRTCVVLIADAVEKIGTQMTAARAGGEYK